MVARNASASNRSQKGRDGLATAAGASVEISFFHSPRELDDAPSLFPVTTPIVLTTPIVADKFASAFGPPPAIVGVTSAALAAW